MGNGLGEMLAVIVMMQGRSELTTSIRSPWARIVSNFGILTQFR